MLLENWNGRSEFCVEFCDRGTLELVSFPDRDTSELCRSVDTESLRTVVERLETWDDETNI